MAAKITHLEALRQSIYMMEHGDSIQKEIALLLNFPGRLHYASLGAIAPDMFYFYNVMSRKKNKMGQKWANLLHHKNVLEMILALLDNTAKEAGDKKKRLLSFVLGYVSHCAVDIVTHPYIFYIAGDYYSGDLKKAEKAQLNHLRVEYALDSYLVHERWGMNPHEYNFIQYVDSSLQKRRKIKSGKVDPDVRSLWMKSLASIFPDEFSKYDTKVPEKDDPIDESYRDFILFNRILDTGSATVRFFLRAIDRITFRKSKLRVLLLPPRENIPDRLPNLKHSTWKYPASPEKSSEESFMDLMHRAARFSNEIMRDAVLYMEGSLSRAAMEKKYSNYNLDTGIRKDSIEMSAFDTEDY
jgi:hypothetical protein